ncbi:hypothetical protein PAHAL_9G529300 [Panicum hallii]|uniref:Uncharacterized protein n=1 Tax=Panicum hallii TaxID=206008 RepID=A0A2T8I5J1_9POAL|nr:hypothetical protein PAHAL_9G529300 [Panicum hallii]
MIVFRSSQMVWWRFMDKTIQKHLAERRQPWILDQYVVLEQTDKGAPGSAAGQAQIEDHHISRTPFCITIFVSTLIIGFLVLNKIRLGCQTDQTRRSAHEEVGSCCFVWINLFPAIIHIQCLLFTKNGLSRSTLSTT